MRKGQVSVELMVVVGFILLLFIPVILLSYFQIVELNEDLSKIQSKVAVTRLSNTVNSLGWMGNGSSVIMEVYVPQNSNLEFVSYDPGGEIQISSVQVSGDYDSISNTWFGLISDQPSIDVGGNYRFNITSAGFEVIIGTYN